MGGISGDFGRLDAQRRALAKIQSAGWRRGLAANLGEEALEQVAIGFERQVDPYDRRWPASWRAARTGGQTLSLSGRLRRSFSRGALVARPSGFTVSTNVVYARAHQKGAVIEAKRGPYLRFRGGAGTWAQVQRVKLPRRMMLPEGRIGRRWQKAFDAAGEAYIRETLT